MPGNLITAIKKQKKLILIFLLTVFIPSVTLSIFGIITLRNERFRLEKQFRERQLDLVNVIKSGVDQKLTELENELKYLAESPSLINNNPQGIITSIDDHLGKNRLCSQFFVKYKGNEPWFPPFLTDGDGFNPITSTEFAG